MSEVRHHYEALLGAHYSWSLGDFDARVAASRAFFAAQLAARVAPESAPAALDLGCGTGVQTLALAQLGYQVTGVDFSPRMLAEYAERTASAGARAVVSDLTDFDVDTGFAVAVCFGDTVAHLADWPAVRSLCRRAFDALAPGGVWLLSSRDHSVVLAGDARFLLIRADETRSMMCFVEDAGERIRVTDLIQSRGPTGTTLQSHSYWKLRVSPTTLTLELNAAGFRVESLGSHQGQHVLAAHAPILESK